MRQASLMPKSRRPKNLALGSAAAAILLMAATAGAMAQPPDPGSLPGGFTTNQSGTTYVILDSKGTIKIGSGASNSVLQWGSSATQPALGQPVYILTSPGHLPTATPNEGFSIGSGATLTLQGGGAGATLVNDVTGNPSEIYGALNAGSLHGPLYIANASGIVVGPNGSIEAPTAGLGLIAYPLDSSAFDGTVSVSDVSVGGDVTVMSGANITGASTILAAGEGTVNVSLPNHTVYTTGGSQATSSICINSSCSTLYALAGVAFHTDTGSVAPVGTSSSSSSYSFSSSSSSSFSFLYSPYHHHSW